MLGIGFEVLIIDLLVSNPLQLFFAIFTLASLLGIDLFLILSLEGVS